MSKKPHAVPLLIAEIANSHGGSLSYLRRLTEALCRTAVPAVKFQYIVADDFLTPIHPQYQLFRSFEFPQSEFSKIVRLVHRARKKAYFDVFGEKSLALADRVGADGFKIYASDIGNDSFIKKVISYGKPVLISVGGATLSEIDAMVSLCAGKAFCLMVGFQAFPTPIVESNVNRIKFLRERYGCPVGYMDHSPASDPFSAHVPCLAMGVGACCIEKHAFLKERETLYDWQSAYDPSQFDQLLQCLKLTHAALGAPSFLLSHSEQDYSRSKRKLIVAARPIRRGAQIRPKDITGRCARLSPRAQFFTINQSDQVVGHIAQKEIQLFEVISPESIYG
ncbi:MAG: N-acetylneuraminate synthase family protein [Elusimicrobia bacterium]|nr:N-acetylneuraminate synthase family protein [Elusimicrobiota bacterium]